jgi:hypothetical protein
MLLRVATLAALLFAPLYSQVPATSQASAALPEGRTIINRHIAAVGGRQAILARKSMHATGTLSVPASGISGAMEIFNAAHPDRVITRAQVQGIGEILDGFDGTHAWAISPLTGATLKTGKELEQAKLDADFYAELRDPAKYPEVTTVEKTTFEGRPCYKVRVKRIDGIEDFDFYDVETGLRAGSINTRETQMGTMTVTSSEGEYKLFGKLKQATSVTQKMMGVEQHITLSTVEYDKVDPAVFQPPAAIKALIK